MGAFYRRAKLISKTFTVLCDFDLHVTNDNGGTFLASGARAAASGNLKIQFSRGFDASDLSGTPVVYTLADFSIANSGDNPQNGNTEFGSYQVDCANGLMSGGRLTYATLQAKSVALFSTTDLTGSVEVTIPCDLWVTYLDDGVPVTFGMGKHPIESIVYEYVIPEGANIGVNVSSSQGNLSGSIRVPVEVSLTTRQLRQDFPSYWDVTPFPVVTASVSAGNVVGRKGYGTISGLQISDDGGITALPVIDFGTAELHEIYDFADTSSPHPTHRTDAVITKNSVYAYAESHFYRFDGAYFANQQQFSLPTNTNAYVSITPSLAAQLDLHLTDWGDAWEHGSIPNVRVTGYRGEGPFSRRGNYRYDWTGTVTPDTPATLDAMGMWALHIDWDGSQGVFNHPPYESFTGDAATLAVTTFDYRSGGIQANRSFSNWDILFVDVPARSQEAGTQNPWNLAHRQHGYHRAAIKNGDIYYWQTPHGVPLPWRIQEVQVTDSGDCADPKMVEDHRGRIYMVHTRGVPPPPVTGPLSGPIGVAGGIAGGPPISVCSAAHDGSFDLFSLAALSAVSNCSVGGAVITTSGSGAVARLAFNPAIEIYAWRWLKINVFASGASPADIQLRAYYYLGGTFGTAFTWDVTPDGTDQWIDLLCPTSAAVIHGSTPDMFGFATMIDDPLGGLAALGYQDPAGVASAAKLVLESSFSLSAFPLELAGMENGRTYTLEALSLEKRTGAVLSIQQDKYFGFTFPAPDYWGPDVLPGERLRLAYGWCDSRLALSQRAGPSISSPSRGKNLSEYVAYLQTRPGWTFTSSIGSNGLMDGNSPAYFLGGPGAWTFDSDSGGSWHSETDKNEAATLRAQPFCQFIEVPPGIGDPAQGNYEGNTFPIRFALRSGEPFRGAVFDTGGAPRSGHHVKEHDERFGTDSTAITGSDGSYAVSTPYMHERGTVSVTEDGATSEDWVLPTLHEQNRQFRTTA